MNDQAQARQKTRPAGSCAPRNPRPKESDGPFKETKRLWIGGRGGGNSVWADCENAQGASRGAHAGRRIGGGGGGGNSDGAGCENA